MDVNLAGFLRDGEVDQESLVGARSRVHGSGETAGFPPQKDKNSSGDEIANVNFYAVRPEATRIR